MKLFCIVLTIFSLSVYNCKVNNLKSDLTMSTETNFFSSSSLELTGDDSIAYGVAANGGNYLPLNAVLIFIYFRDTYHLRL